MENEPAKELNRIRAVGKDYLAAFTSDKRLWKFTVENLRNHPDFTGVDDLDILGVLENGSEETLAKYGREQTNDLVGGLGHFGLRHSN